MCLLSFLLLTSEPVLESSPTNRSVTDARYICYEKAARLRKKGWQEGRGCEALAEIFKRGKTCSDGQVVGRLLENKWQT